MLNNKGFTMVELLMVVCILAVIVAIVVPSVTSYYESSKISTEKIFIQKVTKLVDDYISFNANDLSKGSEVGSIKKCKTATDVGLEYCMDDEDGFEFKNVYEMRKNGGDYVDFSDVINEGLIAESDLINPRTKKKCDPDLSYIQIYQDEDRVNYYRYDLVGCDISESNYVDEKYIFSASRGNLGNFCYDFEVESDSGTKIETECETANANVVCINSDCKYVYDNFSYMISPLIKRKWDVDHPPKETSES